MEPLQIRRSDRNGEKTSVNLNVHKTPWTVSVKPHPFFIRSAQAAHSIVRASAGEPGFLSETFLEAR
jgi:hypothetical protein